MKSKTIKCESLFIYKIGKDISKINGMNWSDVINICDKYVKLRVEPFKKKHHVGFYYIKENHSKLFNVFLIVYSKNIYVVRNGNGNQKNFEICFFVGCKGEEIFWVKSQITIKKNFARGVK